MLSQSLHNLEHQNFGFETRDRYVAWIDPALAGYQPSQLPDLYQRLQERLQNVPGVRAAALSTYAPMSGDDWSQGIRVEGKPEPQPGDNFDAAFARTRCGHQ